MEGRGVTNYDTIRKSYAFSTSTTEFDDALMKHDIVTLEQAMMAKGVASVTEAQRLANLRRDGEKRGINTEESVVNQAVSRGTEEESDGLSSDDDEFLHEYRERRLQEIQRATVEHRFGELLPISRDEWTRQVNQVSHDTWVVVTLVSSDLERTGSVQLAAAQLARKFGDIKFVSIPSQQAIRDWPEEHLPTVFLYRYGQMQHQWIQLPVNTTTEYLEWKLAEQGVVETSQEEPPNVTKSFSGRYRSKIRGYHSEASVFGGTGAQLATRRMDDEESGDY